MTDFNYIINNTNNIHARPLSDLAKIAKDSQCEVTIIKGNNSKDIKKIIAIDTPYYSKVVACFNGSNIGNLIFGIQNFVGCNSEWQDNVAINVLSYKDFLKNKGNSSVGDTVDHVWHIYDPETDTERTVQGINVSGYCIGRVKFGRFADIIASRCTSDNSYWNKNYSDAQYYTASTCRVPLRSVNNANASGGLVYAYAYYASSYSHASLGSRLAVYAYANSASSNSSASYGSRLAFSGKIEIEK